MNKKELKQYMKKYNKESKEYRWILVNRLSFYFYKYYFWGTLILMILMTIVFIIYILPYVQEAIKLWNESQPFIQEMIERLKGVNEIHLSA